ncbi:MAG: helix-turn-helix domain-containing protein [bacterium]
MDYLKSLEKLGLGEKEQKVYLALLQLGKATANEIAYKSKIKRPTTYDILYRFKKDNFSYETEENGKRKFIANPPDKLLRILEEEKKNLEDDLPFLKSIYNINPSRPKVAYFEGLEGIMQLYDDTLTISKNEELLVYVTAEAPEALPDFIPDYVQRRVKKGIRVRGLYQDSAKIQEYLSKNKEQLRISKIVNPKDFTLKNEINIYANKIIILTFKPEPFGVMIESKEIANTQRAIFEMAWRGIK